MNIVETDLIQEGDERKMLTQIIARAFDLPAVEKIERIVLENPVSCAITGERITQGYRVMDVVTDTMGEFLDTFRGAMFGYLSESAARCFKAANPKGINIARAFIVFEDGMLYLPLVSAEAAAEQMRPCWSSLVRDIWPERRGDKCVIILTTDMKKRLWPRARVTTLGSHTHVYLYDNETNEARNISVDWEAMLNDLDVFESMLSAGFSRQSIATSLYRQHNLVSKLGVAQIRKYEDLLQPMREREWFNMLYIIARKQEATDK